MYCSLSWFLCQPPAEPIPQLTGRVWLSPARCGAGAEPARSHCHRGQAPCREPTSGLPPRHLPRDTAPSPRGKEQGVRKHRRSQVKLCPVGLRGRTDGHLWSGMRRDGRRVPCSGSHPPQPSPVATEEMSPGPAPSTAAFPTVPVPLPPGEHPKSPLLWGAGSGAERFHAARDTIVPAWLHHYEAGLAAEPCSPSQGAQGCTPEQAQAAPTWGQGSVLRRGVWGSPQSSPDAEEGSGFVHLDITHGAVLVRLQVANDAGFADCGERLSMSRWTDGRGGRAPVPARQSTPHRLRAGTAARLPRSGPIHDPAAPCGSNARCRMGLGTAGGARCGIATLPRARGTPGCSTAPAGSPGHSQECRHSTMVVASMK